MPDTSADSLPPRFQSLGDEFLVDGPHLNLSPVRVRDRLEDYDFNRNEAEHERG